MSHSCALKAITQAGVLRRVSFDASLLTLYDAASPRKSFWWPDWRISHSKENSTFQSCAHLSTGVLGEDQTEQKVGSYSCCELLDDGWSRTVSATAHKADS